MTRILVAGGSGYIGSRVRQRLAADPAVEVLAIARRASPHALTLDLAAQPRELRAVVREFRPHAVINCAGTISADLRETVSAHVVATANLLQSVADNAPSARFVQIGSAAEYGQAVEAPQLIDEDSVPRPEGPYGVSKLAATQLALTHARQRRAACVVLRVFNLLGPEMPQGTVVARVMAFLAGRRDPAEAIELGRLDVYRDFVHVDDVVEAVVAAAGYVPDQPEIFNIASGEPVLVRTLVRELLDSAGHDGDIVESAPGSARSAGVTWQHADIGRARLRLGWSPRITRAAALDDLARLVARQRA